MKNILKDKNSIKLILIIVIAILIRIVFIGKTSISFFQYDVGLHGISKTFALEEQYEDVYENYDKDDNAGTHINYIMYIYNFNKLPSSANGQFYQPPLSHFLFAMWLKVADLLFSSNCAAKLESMQLLPLIYSIVILITSYKILKEFNIDKKYIIFSMFLIAFYPLNVIMSGTINNDELVTMFEMLLFLYLIRWEKDASYKNLIIGSILLGLGLLTKSSIVVLFIPMMFMFIFQCDKFVSEDKKIGKLFLQALIMILIVVLLGGTFHIYKAINGLNTVGIVSPNEEMKVVGKTLFERFGLTNLFTWNHYNIWNYMFYTSIVYLELNYAILPITIACIISAILTIVALIYAVKNLKETKYLLITAISWIVAFIALNILMPYTCSMCSRYMSMFFILIHMILGIGLNNEKSNLMKKIIYFLSIVMIIFGNISYFIITF